MLDHLQRKRKWSWLKAVGAKINSWQWLTLETGPVSVFLLFLFIAFHIWYLCFKMIFLMMIQLVTGQWWPTVEHQAKNKENVQWNESERNKSSKSQDSVSQKKLFQIEINFWTKILIWEFILNFIGPYYIGHIIWSYIIDFRADGFETIKLRADNYIEVIW